MSSTIMSHFDPRTAVISAVGTVLLMPLLYLALRVTARHMKSWVEKGVDGFLYILSQHVHHRLAARITLKAYARIILAATRYVAVPSSRDINLEIDNIFVTLNLENAGTAQRTVTHFNILAAANRMRLIGDPGSGKSCLVKRLLRDCAQDAIRKPGEAKLPVLLELRNLSVPSTIGKKKSGEWLYRQIKALAATANVHKMDECFETYATGPGLLVLLDGLDEIASPQYPRAEAAINGLATFLDNKGPNNIIVVTSRTQFHYQVREAYVATFPSVYSLRPFTPTDIYEFLTRWPFQGNPRQQVNRVYGELTDRPTLRELCGNPLILSMYVAEGDGVAEQLVPDSRTEFYSRIADELLVNRRVRQTGVQGGRTALRNLREEVLGKLALNHLLNIDEPANSLSWPAAITAIRERFDLDEGAAEAEFNALARETGLFSLERSSETFRFIHLTLCEYLAAAAAVKHTQGGWTELMRAHRQHDEAGSVAERPRLLEVLPFACGLLHQVDRDQALDDIARLGDNRLLARCLLETKRYDHPAFARFVETAHASVIEPDREWDEDWLFDFHLFNMVVRDAAIAAERTGVRLYLPEFDEVLQQVVAARSGALARLIVLYAEKDAAAVFRVAELAGIDLVGEFPLVVIESLDQRPFMELLIERAGKVDGTANERWALVFAEAGLRSRIVAKELHAKKALVNWENAVLEVPSSRSWSRSTLFGDSLYMQSLTLATNSQGISNAWLVASVAKMPAPGSLRWLNVSRTLPAAAIVFLALITLDEMKVWRGFGSLYVRTAVVCMLGIWFVATYVATFMRIGVRTLYRTVVGLREGDLATTSLSRTFMALTLMTSGKFRDAAFSFAGSRKMLLPGETDDILFAVLRLVSRRSLRGMLPKVR